MNPENLLKKFEDKIKQAGYTIESGYVNTNWIDIAIQADEIMIWTNLKNEADAENEAKHLIQIAESYFSDLQIEIYRDNVDANSKYANLELTISKINQIVAARRKKIIAGI